MNHQDEQYGWKDFGQSGRLKNDSKPYRLWLIARPQVQCERDAPIKCRLFPHLALSLGERENHRPRGEKPESLLCSGHSLSCSLSPRERVRVRGNRTTFGALGSTTRESVGRCEAPAKPDVS
jgi:hypothetical protein